LICINERLRHDFAHDTFSAFASTHHLPTSARITTQRCGIGNPVNHLFGLRWRDVDLESGSLQVTQVVEQTKSGVSIKEPKTERSRRTIILPPRLVQELRTHRIEQAAWRLRLGLGKDARELVFPVWDGKLWWPRAFTKAFTREVKAAKLPHVTFTGCGIRTSRTCCAAVSRYTSFPLGLATLIRP
jgi:integrase